MADRSPPSYGCRHCENKAVRRVLRELKQWKAEEARTPPARPLTVQDLIVLHLRHGQ